ncbi:non-hydrolyzing UDP-N-acetylglucosamine 2-epimerase [Bradyrhizobium sp.]|uniref:non-hydrolyzing UDP-N-acetylglucosamine 2-epimerase n=1 Tax=Bradyrhizobium sp. TaxID=376 RepID=UPI00272483BF|nr:UDP-N-acetylglucosamine 2-epimerase (non-hydrolyzing) [Bradyrhizobium sp.]MDO9299348.1 UDP-N-acetylglucosamine 2-epimerase (non-hydrolyzing) [Bradyrhizobium sp.]
MINAHIVVGARPNFMKVAPLFRAMSHESWIKPALIHTGQHYSENMSDAFFSDLGLPPPAFNLGARGETHARQTAAIMIAYEDLLLAGKPDWVIVVGDVNSTLAAALAAKKLNIPVAHLEAGLRNFDRTLPEEINRIVTDSISDLLWAPSVDACENLRREGVDPAKIDLVGNIMIDSYLMLSETISQASMAKRIGIPAGKYVVVTLHRPANVDDPNMLTRIVDALRQLATSAIIVFPVHPRTRTKLEMAGLIGRLQHENIRLIEPMGYVAFMSLVQSSALVITDSGGIQEETSYIGIPCLTLRTNTERPITITLGTNQLVTPETLLDAATVAISRGPRLPSDISLWDGHTASRVVASLARHAKM